MVFENIGDPRLFAKAFAAMSRRGRLVTAGGHGGGIVPLDVNRLYHNQISVIGATGETRGRRGKSLQAAAEGQIQGGDRSGSAAVQSGPRARDRRSRGGIGKVVLEPRDCEFAPWMGGPGPAMAMEI